MEDIIETLLGREIMDETDTVIDMQALVKNKKIDLN
jgi:CBS domain containing-hemolysin-like protein